MPGLFRVRNLSKVFRSPLSPVKRSINLSTFSPEIKLPLSVNIVKSLNEYKPSNRLSPGTTAKISEKLHNPINIRLASFSELSQAVMVWGSRKEGWNSCIGDAEALQAANCSCYVSTYNGVPIASLLTVQYRYLLQGQEQIVADLGIYTVDKKFRKNGYGLQVWNHAHSKLPENATVCLYGVMAQVHNYEKSGYQKVCKVSRMSVTLAKNTSEKTDDQNTVAKEDAAESKPRSSGQQKFFVIHVNQEMSKEELSAYKKDILNYHHTISHTMTLPILEVRMTYGETYVAVDEKGVVVGYGICTPCLEGDFRIAPLFANSSEIANEIYNGCVKKLPEGASVTMDVFNPEKSSIAKSLPFFSKDPALKATNVLDTIYMLKFPDPKKYPNADKTGSVIDEQRFIGVPSLCM